MLNDEKNNAKTTQQGPEGWMLTLHSLQSTHLGSCLLGFSKPPWEGSEMRMLLSPGSCSCSMDVHHSLGIPQPPQDWLRVSHVLDLGCYGTSEGGKIWEV